MGLSGLWHGAAWNFILWGLYHGLLVFCYHQAGMGGNWVPRDALQRCVAWTAMSCFTLFGWMLFRTPNMAWLVDALGGMTVGLSGDSLLAGLALLSLVALYWIPISCMWVLDRYAPNGGVPHAVFHGLVLASIAVFGRETGTDFIYFRF